MRTARAQSLLLLLSSGSRVSAEPASDAPGSQSGRSADIDEQYLRTPFYGWRKMVAYLRRLGYAVNGKRVRRLMRLMGIQAIYPRRSSSSPGKGTQALSLPVTQSADYACQPGLECRHHLCAAAAWLHVPGRCHRLAQSLRACTWQLSNTLDGIFCLDALRQGALQGSAPDLQHRPRRTVHGRRLHRLPARS